MRVEHASRSIGRGSTGMPVTRGARASCGASRIAAPPWSLLKYTNASLASAAAIRDAHRRKCRAGSRHRWSCPGGTARRATRRACSAPPGARSMRPDEGGAMSVELVEHVGGVPRGISELERRAHRAREVASRRRNRTTSTGNRGELEQHRTEPVPEPFRPFPEALDGLLRIVQPLEVGDEPARLHGDDEPGRGLLAPALERGAFGEPVKELLTSTVEKRPA